MPTIDTITRFLNRELGVRRIPDVSRNGLQVRGKKKVLKAGFAVDASLSTFEKARRAGVDLLVVHHGLLWKGLRDTTGVRKQRIAFLKRNRTSLYACHLPLDAHHEYGNNIQLAQLLGLEDIRPFGRYHGVVVGFEGRLARARRPKEIAAILRRKLRARCVVLDFGPKRIRTVGLMSGGGSFALVDAFRNNLDCLVTGEAPHYVYHEAKDRRQNVIIAGHYETETVGVKALMPLVREEFGVMTVFLNVSTSI